MGEDRKDDERPLAHHPNSPVANEHRDALDAEDIEKLKSNPSDRDGRLDINVDESFPASDPASITQPRRSNDPPPGGKYN